VTSGPAMRQELAELGEPATGLVVIEGPPGSGRSTLLDDLLRRLSQGRLVLAADCGRLDTEYPFGLIRQLIEPLFASPELAGMSDSIGPVRAALAEDEVDLLRLQDAVERLARDLARHRPLLICVDDAHWGDAPSMACLAHLARRAARQPVLIALTRCPQVLITPPDGLTELLLRPDCVRIQPAPLTERQVAALIGDVTAASGGLARFCHRATEGNPQMLIELVRAMTEAGTGIEPHSGAEARSGGLVAEVSARRAVELLRRQPDEVQDLTVVLAVLGECGPDVAADLTQQEPAQVKHWLEELVRLGLLRHTAAGRPVIACERVRAAVRNGLPMAERDELRIRAARALSVRGAPIEHVAAAVLGTRPAGDPWVIEVLCEAARSRAAVGYPEEVAGYLQRVLKEQLEPGRRAGLLLQLGTARMQGDPEAAGRHFREAANLSDDRRMHAAALIGLCQAGLLLQQPLEVTPELAGAIEELTSTEDMTDADRGALLRLRAMQVIADGTEDRIPSPAPPRPAGLCRVTPAECELLSAFALRISERGGRAEEAVELALRAMSGTSLRDRDSHGVFVRSVSVLLYADHLDAAMQWAGRMTEIGGRYRWRLCQLVGRGLRAEAAFRMGDLELSLAEARAAFGSTGRTDRGAYHALAVASLTRVLIELDRPDEAEAFLDEHGAALIGTPRARVMMHATRARLLARRGDVVGALHDLLEAGRLLGALQIVNPAILPWRSQAAELYAELGDLDRARELAEEEQALARDWGASRAIGIALRARGKADGGARGVRLLEEAIDALAGGSARLELAAVYLELGISHRLRASPAQARRALRNAAVVAEQCGAQRLLNRVRAELLLSGARPRAARQSGPAALTPSERRVAGLAAQGHTNRQIARLLSVSPNTVEVHLTNAYRKLAISSRAQLPEVLMPAR
jgi:DNA-binding CsgD family transcriptional regulator/tetratricopeptide (TPR) repeat protein